MTTINHVPTVHCPFPELLSDTDRLDFVESNLSISEGNIRAACVRQADMVHIVGELTAECRYIADVAKWKFDQTKAQVELSVRAADPAQYGLTKITDSAVSAIVTSDDAVGAAKEQYMKASQLLSWMLGLQQSVYATGSSIDNIVKMNVSLNYALPTTEERLNGGEDEDD